MVMKYRILALDDMEVRHHAFRHWFRNHTLDEAKDAPSAITLLDNFDYDLVMLDHDLAEEHYLTLSEGLSESRLPGQDEYKPGTGMDVAKHIAGMKSKPGMVIIHSYNPGGRAAMAQVLREAGVKFLVRPFNSLDPVRFK